MEIIINDTMVVFQRALSPYLASPFSSFPVVWSNSKAERIGPAGVPFPVTQVRELFSTAPANLVKS